MDDGQPPAPDGVETCDYADTRANDAHEPEPNTSPAMVAPALKVDRCPHEAAATAAPTADGTVVLPDEVLVAVFNFCDARTRMMAIPAVSKRWLCVCQHLMRRRLVVVDLTWAVRNCRCALTDVGLAGLVLRFPNLQHLNLSYCGSVTDGGVAAVAAGCPNLQHLDLSECDSVTDDGVAAVAAACPNLQHLHHA